MKYHNDSSSSEKEGSMDLAAQSGAAYEVVNRFGSASKEHFPSVC